MQEKHHDALEGCKSMMLNPIQMPFKDHQFCFNSNSEHFFILLLLLLSFDKDCTLKHSDLGKWIVKKLFSRTTIR